MQIFVNASLKKLLQSVTEVVIEKLLGVRCAMPEDILNEFR